MTSKPGPNPPLPPSRLHQRFDAIAIEAFPSRKGFGREAAMDGRFNPQHKLAAESLPPRVSTRLEGAWLRTFALHLQARFLAGTFLAVVLSSLALFLTFIVLVFDDKGLPHGTLAATIWGALLMALIAFAIVANGRYRLLRLKEVDTVFDAFYLVHRHAAQCSQCNRSGTSGLYDERRSLVEDAFSTGMSLQQLVALMRSRSHGNPMLSSLYFAGADRDHPYFLHNDRVAVGLSVLPEDERKSLVAKRHVHQNEVIVVLDGELHLDILTNGAWQRTDLVAGQVKVIAPGDCHRIVSKDQENAAFLFIKTRPAEQPREERCSEGEQEPQA